MKGKTMKNGEMPVGMKPMKSKGKGKGKKAC
jgi:hypothetical protein